MFAKELNGLVDGHLQHLIHIASPEGHLQNVMLEPFAVTTLTGQGEVCHELHFHGHRTFSLALLASSAIGIETEVCGRVSHLLGQRLGSKQLAYLVPGLDIGDGIGT